MLLILRDRLIFRDSLIYRGGLIFRGGLILRGELIFRGGLILSDGLRFISLEGVLVCAYMPMGGQFCLECTVYMSLVVQLEGF